MAALQAVRQAMLALPGGFRSLSNTSKSASKIPKYPMNIRLAMPSDAY
jgi:hypothetical protein